MLSHPKCSSSCAIGSAAVVHKDDNLLNVVCSHMQMCMLTAEMLNDKAAARKSALSALAARGAASDEAQCKAALAQVETDFSARRQV